MRLIAVAKAHYSHANLQESSVRKTILVTYIREPCDGVSLGRALLRHQRRDAVIGRMIIVREQSNGKDVRGSRVHLGFKQVATAQQMVAVSVRWQLLYVDIVVLHFEAIEEPGTVTNDGSGKG